VLVCKVIVLAPVLPFAVEAFSDTLFTIGASSFTASAISLLRACDASGSCSFSQELNTYAVINSILANLKILFIVLILKVSK
jgi:hypothetical protein